MSLNIKKLINQGCTTICDTNVYLHIYRYSPEFSDFALRCMQAVGASIEMPSTVRFEFLKHQRAYFGDMERRVQRIGKSVEDEINKAARKVLNVCDNLQALQYPDVDILRKDLSEKFDELREIPEKFFEDRTILEFIANPWNGKNLVYDFVEEIRSGGRVMPAVTQEEIYQICEEGEKRYKQDPPVPPGFKDAKNKDGVRKYSDLILWKEIIRYAKANDTDIIFVTDDVKSDWWVDNKGSKSFHPNLISEFESETGRKIFPFTSVEFYSDISVSYGISKTDAVEIALRLTDDDYFERICDSVWDNIYNDLYTSGDSYIAAPSHIGTYGPEELEITENQFVSAEQIDRDEDVITYKFTYWVEAEGTSYDYWGRDDDTKEIITSPVGSHTFEGEIQVEVTREADMYLDFEGDEGFESASIISGSLKETRFQPYYEEEYVKDAYDTCPECGKRINRENDGGNGFCIDCAPNH